MPGPVKPRPYRSVARARSSAQTRARVVAAAQACFAQLGYAATPVAEIARRAGVSVDTVYASVGRKPQLVLAVVDELLGEGQGPVPAEQRAYVAQVRAAPDARAKIEAYAAALGRVMPDVAPLLRALARAGEDDPACAEAWRQVDERRAANMRRLAADLRGTGEVRAELSDDDVATLVWSTNSWEYRDLLARRGVTGAAYAVFLTDLWTRALLSGGGRREG
jgi:AcrR family transcriptional regulator